MVTCGDHEESPSHIAIITMVTRYLVAQLASFVHAYMNTQLQHHWPSINRLISRYNGYLILIEQYY